MRTFVSIAALCCIVCTATAATVQQPAQPVSTDNNIVIAMARQWGETFPMRIVIDGVETTSLEVAETMMAEFANNFKKYIDMSPLTLSDDALMAINAIAIEMVKEWRKAFPMPYNDEDIIFYAKGEVLAKINTQAVNAVHQIMQQFPVALDTNGFRMSIGGASASINYITLMNINTAIINMFKSISQLMPVTAGNFFTTMGNRVSDAFPAELIAPIQGPY